jgi:hypothetical protein
MVEWLRATLNPLGEGFPPFTAYTEADFLRLAARGAFLKICPAAAGLLAGRPDLIPLLVSAVEKLTVGVIMLDEQFDWAEDLFIGRYNTFVAYCSDQPQTEPYREINRRAVLKDIFLRNHGQPYFEVLQSYLQQAHHQAVLACCAGLAGYIDWFQKEAQACGDWLANSAHTYLESMSECTLTKKVLG